jgi:integrase
MHYRTKLGDERRPKLDDTTVLSLAQAREIGREMLVAVAAGKDPVAERAELRDAPTLGALLDRIYAKRWAKQKQARELKRTIDVYIPERLKKTRVVEVTYDDMADLHERVTKNSGPAQANRLLSHLSTAFSYAERPLKWRPMHSNPCAGVERNKERKRKVFLTPDKLARFIPELATLATKSPQAAAYLRFMLYTGCRPEEAAAITPEMVDGDVVRLADAKTGARDIYLSEQALAALKSVPWRPGCSILGPWPRTRWHFEQIRARLGMPELWARDLRRTFGSFALTTAHGAQTGELLGHKSAQTTKIYTQLIQDTARAAARAAANQIDAMAAGIFN